MKKPLSKTLLHTALAPLKWLLALVILFEEWGWEPLQRALAALGRWPGLRWIESAVRRAPPWLALVLFCVPALALLPVKLLALWLIGEGHTLTGLAVMMQLAWFARWYGRWTLWKARLLAQVRASAPWRMARVLKRTLRRLATRWMRAIRS